MNIPTITAAEIYSYGNLSDLALAVIPDSDLRQRWLDWLDDDGLEGWLPALTKLSLGHLATGWNREIEPFTRSMDAAADDLERRNALGRT